MEGAVAAQLGTAFLLADEAGSSPVHRKALQDPQFTETVVTKAFSGRYARGLHNRFIDDHEAQAPFGYPEIHYLTGPLRAGSVRAGDPQGTNVWAGTGFTSIRAGSVAEIMRPDSPSAASSIDDVAVVGSRGDHRGGALAVRCVCGTRTAVDPRSFSGVGVDHVGSAGRQRDADVAVVGGRVHGARGGVLEVDLDVAVRRRGAERIGDRDRRRGLITSPFCVCDLDAPGGRR